MNRKLIDYLPPVLRGITELEAIAAAQQPEMEAAWNALERVMDNQFIDTATEDGITAWENELAITPLAADTLDDRRRRLKAAWLGGALYTSRWLADWIKTAGGDGAPPPVVENYVLHPALPVSSDYPHIIGELRRYVPANLHISPSILLTERKMTHYTGAAFRISMKRTVRSDRPGVTYTASLADENGNALTDEENNILYEEVFI